jgi:RHS repeat-associated protein
MIAFLKRRAWTIAVACAGITTVAAGVEPVLVVDAAQFEGALTLPAMPLQKIATPRRAVAVNLDGSQAQTIFWGLSVHANPWQDGVVRLGGAGDVQLKNGAYSPTELDFGLPTRGPSIPIGRTFDFTGSGEGLDSGPQGWNWHQSAWPELVRNGNYLAICFGGDRHLGFRNINPEAPADTFRGINGVAGAVVSWTLENKGIEHSIYSYYDGAGNRADFFGEGVELGGVSLFGRFWRLVDAEGRAAHVGADPAAGTESVAALESGFDSMGRIKSMIDGAGRQFGFSYANEGNRLVEVSVATEHHALASVEYEYYTSNGPHGLVGDLRLVTTRTRLSPTGPEPDSGPELVRKQYYRYWTNEAHSSGSPGHRHLVRMVVDAEGCRRFDCEPRTGNNGLPVNMDDASDEELHPFATHVLEYDSARRVSRSTLPGETTSSDTISEYFYQSNGSFTGTTNVYDTTWASRTIVKHASARWVVNYFDESGQSLNTAVADGRPVEIDSTAALFSRSWNTDLRRDGNGQIDRIATPASLPLGSIAPVSSPTRGGQMMTIDRVPSGVMKGFVRAVRHQKGGVDSGNGSYPPYLLHSVEYVGETEGSDYVKAAVGTGGHEIVRPLVRSTRQYDTQVTTESQATPTSAPKTQFAYSVAPGTLAIVEIVTTLPAVSSERFGSGLAGVRRTWFSKDGLARFTRSPTGRINYFEYDGVSGRVARSVQDADTTAQGDIEGVVPSSDYVSASTATLLRRTRAYAYDPWGRLTRSQTPDQRISALVYSRLKDQRPVVISAPRIDATSLAGSYTAWSGPATVSVLTLDGSISATMTVADARRSESGNGWSDRRVVYDSTEPLHYLIEPDATGDVLSVVGDKVVGGLESFSRGMLQCHVYTRSGRQMLRTQRFYGTSPESHFDSIFAYDPSGRLSSTTTPAGTIDRFIYDDAAGRLIETQRGTSPSNFVTTARYEFDHNSSSGGGNGLLTMVERNTIKDASGAWASNPTKYYYDYRDRPVGIHNAAAPHQLVAYDNQSRVSRVGLLGESPGNIWGDEFLVEASDGGEGLASLRALAEWNYDERGRVHLERRYNVNQFDGSIPSGIGRSLSRATVFGAEGSVRATFGSVTMAADSSTTVKYERNRACEITIACVVAQTAQPANYQAAIAVQPSDVVLKETRYMIDQKSGRVNGYASITRGPQPDACVSLPSGGSLFPPGFITSDDGNFVLNAANPGSGVDPFNGRLDIGMIWYDKLGRPRIEADWGYRRAADEDWPFPLAYNKEYDEFTASLPARLRGQNVDLNNDPLLPARVRTKFFNPLGLLENESGPDGTGRYTLYDFAGRPTGAGSSTTNTGNCGEGAAPPFGGDYNPCRVPPAGGYPTPEEQWDYDDDGRIHCSSVVTNGGVKGFCNIYPDGAAPWESLPNNPYVTDPLGPIFGVHPEHLAAPYVVNNDVPIGRRNEGYLPITSDPWPTEERDQNFTWYSYDAQGRPIQVLEPDARRTTILYDPVGRVREIEQIPLTVDPITNLPKPRRVQTGFDPLGRPWEFEEFDHLNRSNTQPNSRVRVKYDAFGNPLGMFTDFFPEGGGDPILGMALKQKFGIRDIDTSGFPWLNSLCVPIDIELPGGLDIKPRYSDCGSSSPLAFLTDFGLAESGKFDPSAMLGRVTAIDYYKWSKAPHLYPLGGHQIDLDAVRPNVSPSPMVPPPFHELILKSGYLGIADPSWFNLPVLDDPEKSLIQPKDICFCTNPTMIEPGRTNPNRWGEPTVDPWEMCQGVNCDPMRPLNPYPWQKDNYDRDGTDGGVKKEEICAGTNTMCNPEVEIDAGHHDDCPPPPFCAGPAVTQLEDPPKPSDGTIKRSAVQRVNNTPIVSEELTVGRVSQKLREFKRTVPARPAPYELRMWGALHVESGSTNQTTTYTYSDNIATPHRLHSFTRNGTMVYTVAYDTRGNLIDDGVQFMYDYDVAGNLTHVYLREFSGSGGSVSKGKLHARFRYDALNRKISAVYDDNPDGFGFPRKTTEDVFDNEVIEFYGYNERWRLVSVWRQNTKGTLNILTGANAPPGQRPPPALYERIIHRYVGRGGKGEGWFHDAPIYSQINKDWQADIYGDDLIDGDENEPPDPESGYTPDNDLCPTWEIERQYLQSQIDGDILGVIDYFADGSRQTTRFDYSMFGLPRLLPTNTVPGSAFGGDIDNDDNINNGLHPDGQSDISDLIAFLIMFENGDPRGDLANTTGHPIPDGGTDVSDLVYMLQQFQGGLSVTAEPVRFGWRAYQWDGRLNLYHVRHRTFDPKLITWLQPDPLGEVDGLNVYAYCGWDPFNKIDPMGLAWWNPLTWWDPPGPNLDPHDVVRAAGPGHQIGLWTHHYDGNGNYIEGASTFVALTGDPEADARQEQVLRQRAAIMNGARSVHETTENVADAIVLTARVVSEPIDLAITATEIMRNPTNPWSYLGLLPVVPGGFRRALDDGSDVFKFNTLSESTFRENLEILLGRTIDSSTERAHHIVAHSAKYESARRAREILTSHGIHVHDPLNGAALKIKFHEGLHTHEYYDWVRRELEAVTSADEAKRVLQRIRETLEKGETPWKAAPGGAGKCE